LVCRDYLAGPWAVSLLADSKLSSSYQLDLVRGSHILFDSPLERGYFLPVPGEQRICFALPYQGKTLVGTTEIRQTLEQPIRCSEAEAKYLVKLYNSYFNDSKSVNDINHSIAGVRPLISSAKEVYKTTREYAIEKQGRIVSVYGGKWTTARALGQKVANAIAKINFEEYLCK